MTEAQRRKRERVHLFHRLVNPINRRLPGQVVLETTGRSSGLARHVPVGGRRQGNSFWLVSNDGRAAHYVRNIEANPRVRVRLRGRWYPGTAHLLDHDDPVARLRQLPRFNSMMVRLLGTSLLTIRIDLDAAGVYSRWVGAVRGHRNAPGVGLVSTATPR
jgi:deazaflavin-dependent oxidoreductase (nitroreductase family)